WDCTPPAGRAIRGSTAYRKPLTCLGSSTTTTPTSLRQVLTLEIAFIGHQQSYKRQADAHDHLHGAFLQSRPFLRRNARGQPLGQRHTYGAQDASSAGVPEVQPVLNDTQAEPELKATEAFRQEVRPTLILYCSQVLPRKRPGPCLTPRMTHNHQARGKSFSRGGQAQQPRQEASQAPLSMADRKEPGPLHLGRCIVPMLHRGVEFSP